MADTSGEKDGKMAAESNQGALAEGLMQIFRPAVEELDSKVISVRYHDAPILSFEDKRAFQFLKKSGIFLFGISFFALEIWMFLYYANETSNDVKNCFTN